MEDNPDLSDLDVTERPKEKEIGNCEVIAVRKGDREEFYEGMEEEDLKHGSMDDEMIQIEVEVSFNGESFPVTDDMRYYDTPTDRSHLGRYLQKYGTPETGQKVTVSFDEEGNASIVY